MKPDRVRVLPLAFLALLLLPATLCAQDLTIYAGGLFPGHVTVNNVRTALDRGPVFGVRLSTGFAAFLKLEGNIALSNDFLFPHNQPGVTSAKGVMVNANLLADLPLGKAVPYVTLGLGLMHQYGSGDLPIGTKFDINYGGGLKLPKMYGPIGFRIDGRGYTATGVFSHSVNMFELSGGVMFSF